MTFKQVTVFLGLSIICQIWYGFAHGCGDKVHQEGPCSSQGGICAKKENCGSFAQEGLCPEQQKNNVECCFKIIGPNQTKPSELNENCGTQGAVCMTRCPDNLIDPTGLCVPNLRCCVLV